MKGWAFIAIDLDEQAWDAWVSAQAEVVLEWLKVWT